jgi:type III restriction enzyme
MPEFEVPEPILNSAFEEPAAHWRIRPHEPPQKVPGRRPAAYFYRDPRTAQVAGEEAVSREEPLDNVNLIRARLAEWRGAGYPGVTRTTLELIRWWRRDGRQHRLFFAQLEAAETIVFLKEARADLLQGIDVPWDEKPDGGRGFRRYACKMATGAGKTTVMGMVAAWSILNKVNARGDARFSEAVLVVCPNVTIRDRLRELDPGLGEASLYRTRDLVPGHLMPSLTQGRVLVTNWHIFEKQAPQVAGVSAKVARAGVAEVTTGKVVIGEKTTTAHGWRYLTPQAFTAMQASGELRVLKALDEAGTKFQVEATRYVESDAAMVKRVLGRDLGTKGNLLVMNDEAHHAYRIRSTAADEELASLFEADEEEDVEEDEREATVWVEGLDRIAEARGVSFCLDLSATPYYLHAAGRDANRPFPWVVSDFSLADAIESGLVKIPQLAVRDSTGTDHPGYYNIWEWIRPKLTAAERGGKKGAVKPEAILKYAVHPLTLLASHWRETLLAWRKAGRKEPPVFIVVCKNTRIAKLVFEWMAQGTSPAAIPPCDIEELRNAPGATVTLRVDTKVVHETDSDAAKDDETRWMRFTLDTVGKERWPSDRQGRPIFPEAFEALAQKLGRALHPPGRDVRAIVSVGMLTEGWDCRTVTHIVGLRPFMSQLLCEQVVGRGLRRASYEAGPDGRFGEEVAKILGVPFEVVPFKATGAPGQEKPEKFHIHALPSKAGLEIRFPRVERYGAAVRNRVTADWATVPEIVIDPLQIPDLVEMKAALPLNRGVPSLHGPGQLDEVSLAAFRERHREQEVAFLVAAALTREYAASPACQVPPHALFPQLLGIVQHYLATKVKGGDPRDLLLAPYFGWLVERLREAIRPDASAGEAPEVPIYERSRGDGSTSEVDFTTTRKPVDVQKSHVNAVVPDTRVWEQSAAAQIDRHPAVEAFVKNAGLGFGIPYLHDGEDHDYVPDFIIRLKGAPPLHLILETKGYDPLKQIKAEAAERWVSAVNADGTKGRWAYQLVTDPADVTRALDDAAKHMDEAFRSVVRDVMERHAGTLRKLAR